MQLTNAKSILLWASLLVFGFGCNGMKKMVVTGAEPIMTDINGAIYAQPDLAIIRAGLPANIIMVEGLVRASPENRATLVMACQAFVGLAFLTEDKDPEHAVQLYETGKEYGLRALRLHRKIRKALENGTSFEEAIKLIDSEKYLPALLWTAVAWGQSLVLRITDPTVLVYGSRVKAILDRVVSLDTDYFYGLAHVILGAYYTFMPSLFVGGPPVVDAEFQHVFKLTKGNFLMAKVLYARYYATLIMDEKLFDKTLKEVVDTPPTVEPDIGFLNALAIEKAKNLISTREEFF
jgi:hypothetical protein